MLGELLQLGFCLTDCLNVNYGLSDADSLQLCFADVCSQKLSYVFAQVREWENDFIQIPVYSCYRPFIPLYAHIVLFIITSFMIWKHGNACMNIKAIFWNVTSVSNLFRQAYIFHFHHLSPCLKETPFPNFQPSKAFIKFIYPSVHSLSCLFCHRSLLEPAPACIGWRSWTGHHIPPKMKHPHSKVPFLPCLHPILTMTQGICNQTVDNCWQLDNCKTSTWMFIVNKTFTVYACKMWIRSEKHIILVNAYSHELVQHLL